MPSALTVSALLKFTSMSWLSSEYMIQANPNCFWLLMQVAVVALSFARLRAGSSIAARMAMMAMTTSNSINVKPLPDFDGVAAEWMFHPNGPTALPVWPLQRTFAFMSPDVALATDCALTLEWYCGLS